MWKHWLFFMSSGGRSSLCRQWHTGFLFLAGFNHKNPIIVFIVLFLFLSFLTELFTDWERRGVEVSCNQQANTADGFWLAHCSVWPVAKESSVGVLESALPLGNNTTTHIFWCLLHTMCTFLCVIPANRNRLWRQEEAFFMTQIPAQEWAHLVIKRSHRKARCPCGVSAAFSSTSLFLCVYLWGKHYRNWQGWSGLQQRGECCRSVLMSEAFNGLSKNRLDRSIDQGLSKPVNMPPSETPELPPSPLHTQLKGDGLQPLWSKDTPFFSF